MLDNFTRRQIDEITEQHKRLDEKFLNDRIKPRIIVFMADGTNMVKPTYDKHDVKIFQNRGPNNVAINVNKYIAKYDFEIARKVKPTIDEVSDEENRAPPEPE